MLNFVLPLTKVEEGDQRLVFGRAAACVPDRSGEVMDWDSGKAAIKEWSESFSKATNGQSFGNVRLMHDSKRVVGKLVDMSFDDAAQAVDVVAHVVEDEAWKLVKAGCITGFSIGGSYARKWADTGSGLTKYTPRLAEISLVDRPCIPDATIAMVKADGTIGEIKIIGRTVDNIGLMNRPRTFNELMKSAPRTYNEILEDDLYEVYGDLAKGMVERAGRSAGEYIGRKIYRNTYGATRLEEKNAINALRRRRHNDIADLSSRGDRSAEFYRRSLQNGGGKQDRDTAKYGAAMRRLSGLKQKYGDMGAAAAPYAAGAAAGAVGTAGAYELSRKRNR